MSLYCRIRCAVRCHVPTKIVGEGRGGVKPEAGETKFNQVQVSRSGSLLPAESTIMGINPRLHVTMDS